MRVLKLLRSSLLIIVLSTVLAAAITTRFSLAGRADSGTQVVSGTVTNQGGTGIGNVSVTATDPGGTTVDYGPVTTASDGTYTLDINTGSYDFHFSPASGYSPVVDSDITVDSNQTINVQLTPLYTLSGVLTDSSGSPLSNIRVSVNNSSGNSAGQVTTGADGRYSFTLAPDTYSINVDDSSTNVGNMNHFDLAQATATVDLTNGNVIQNLQLQTATVQVTLKDASGNPIRNVAVTAQDNGGGRTHLYAGDPGDSMFGTNASATTDSNGNVFLTTFIGEQFGTSDTNNSICANISGSELCIAASLTVSGNTSVVIQEPSNTLSGVLTDSSGSPLSNIRVSVNNSSGNSAGQVTTGADGRYSFTLAPDTYSINVDDSSTNVGNMNHFDLAQATATVDLTNGNVIQNLQLQTATVQVTLKDASGNPIRNVAVTAQDNGGGRTHLYAGDPGDSMFGTNASATTDSNGNVFLTTFIGEQFGTSDTNNSICANISGSELCIAASLTVSGNTSVVIQEVSHTPPTITYNVTPVADTNGNNTGNVLVTFTCTDNSGSGIASCTSPVTVPDEGIGHIVAGTATDNDGNTSMINANASLLVSAVSAGGTGSSPYAADTNYTGGTPYSSTASVDTSNILDSAPQSIYQNSRYGNSFTYTIPGLTPGAAYTLRLDFNELYFGAQAGGGIGSRVFNVAVNGRPALNNFDIYAAAGGSNKAIAEQIPTTADSNGNVTVTFTADTDNAMVNGLALYNGTLPPLPPQPTVNSASIAAGSSSPVGTFSADTDFSGGTPYSSTASVDTSGVANPAPQAVYQSVRYGNTFGYTIPHLAPNTNYNVRLDFNELYWGINGNGGAGSRIFNVAINGTQVLNNFDVYATAGGANKALAENFTATSDAYGNIAINFTGVTDNAMVSGIEVTQQ